MEYLYLPGGYDLCAIEEIGVRREARGARRKGRERGTMILADRAGTGPLDE
jgi:hypothetical protein